MDVPLLICSDTKKDSDVRYLAGTHIPDDVFLIFDGKKVTALVSALEIGRLRAASKIDECVSCDAISSTQSKNLSELDLLVRFLQNLGLGKLRVKRNFPIHFADGLRSAGFEIVVEEFSILPQRLTKSEEEITEIRRSAEIVRMTFSEVTRILADATVDAERRILFEGEILTSERLRAIMESFCFDLGGIGEDTIVSCGASACNPHDTGHGPLLANELILVDFFPRMRSSGYYADVSRTFAKGKPSTAQIDLYETVRHAHAVAIDMVRDGVAVNEITAAVFSIFERRGYQSSKTSNPPYGMFHSLGHGFGLDIHEPPSLNFGDDVLRSGMVVTVEPGLYYDKIGGARVEDDILVGNSASEMLTKIPYDWIIE
ncbi:MAG: Xaa-Pro peptidase family protein [Puniceicoccales bacterium]|jgi:Xaa-Pro aminopeptidase|nr:Xaa-Pro peptidase family protein [Puniceicoccales bacterium]